MSEALLPIDGRICDMDCAADPLALAPDRLRKYCNCGMVFVRFSASACLVLVSMAAARHIFVPPSRWLNDSFASGTWNAMHKAPEAETAREVVDAMNRALNFQPDGQSDVIPWPEMQMAMGPYIAQDFVYDFIYPWEQKQQGLRGWYNGEFSAWFRGFPGNSFVPLVEVGNSEYVSYAAYMLSDWRGSFAGVAPINRTVRIRDLDFYKVKDGRIVYNWCMVDVVNILQQAGHHVLPQAPLPDDPLDNYLPPAIMDGSPAPARAFASPNDAARAERIVLAALHQDFVEFSNAASSWHSNMTWYGPAGIGVAHSQKLFATHFLVPLHAAFKNPELIVDVFVCEGRYCAAHVHLHVHHAGTWLGQNPTGRRIALRMGLHFRVSGDSIVEGWSQIDLLSALAQMGVDPFAAVRQQTGKPDKI